MEENALIEGEGQQAYKEMLSKQKSTIAGEKFTVSYMSVLRVKEVQMMIIAGGLKQVSNEISFVTVGLTSRF